MNTYKEEDIINSCIKFFNEKHEDCNADFIFERKEQTYEGEAYIFRHDIDNGACMREQACFKNIPYIIEYITGKNHKRDTL